MVKNKPSKKTAELDSVYFLKLVMYLIVGAQWLQINGANGKFSFSLPIGLLFGMAFALHDHFQIDRKIEFAVLLIAALIGFYAAVGISVII